MLPPAPSYPDARNTFRWSIPERYNIGVDVCDRWADRDPGRLALIHEHADGRVERLTFGDLLVHSNRAANLLADRGVRRGDRVAILLAQSPQTAVMHIAAYKSGAIAVPLFTLFGPDALEYRLHDSGAALLLTDADGAARVAPLRARLPQLKTVLVTSGAPMGACTGAGGTTGPAAASPPAPTTAITATTGTAPTPTPAAPDAAPATVLAFEPALQAQGEAFTPVDTGADDPALIIYTSGTTGKPKGALHAHRTLLGHLPGVEMSHGGRVEPDDRFWTPADWAWIGGLLDVLLPALHHGVPVVSRRFAKFDAAAAFDLMARHGVRNVFLPPTALKLLRAERDPRARRDLQLRSVASGGESLGAELLAWGREALGVTINEFYGQTECNMTVSSCDTWFAASPGRIGKAVPGHDVQVVDDDGRPLPVGEVGQIAVRAPDPVMFLGYWNNEAATRAKFAGGFLLTGDTGTVDEDGCIGFVGRNDDVITSAGYRIGPGPIEDCLLGHPAVRMAAVVGVPDATRTEVVAAFVVLADGAQAGDALVRELQEHVRTRLAAHEYPRIVRFVEALPMTTTGKVIRRELRTQAGDAPGTGA